MTDTALDEKKKQEIEKKKIKHENKLKEEIRQKWKDNNMRPNPGCRRCHGNGFVGNDMIRNLLVQCRCVKRRPTRGKANGTDSS